MHSKDDIFISHRPGRTYFFIFLAYLSFIVYGSLVPFHFKPMPLEQAWNHFFQVMHPPWKIVSRSDFFANYILFIPFTYLGIGAFTRENTRSCRWAISAAVWIGACLFGAGIEWVQNFFPDRTVSMTDILAQAVGGGVGIFLWVMLGTPWTEWSRRHWRRYIQGRTVVKILLVYAIGLAGYLLLPMDLTLSPFYLYHKYKAGGIVLLPFTDPGGVTRLDIAERFIRLVPIGMLAAAMFRKTESRLRSGIIGGFIFAGGIEFLQLFVESRVSSITDFVLGGLSGLVGGGLVCLFDELRERTRRASSAAK